MDRRDDRATGYLHSLDDQDARARPHSAGQRSSPDRALAYGRQRPASAASVRPVSFEEVYGVEPPPGSSRSPERRRRRAKRGGGQPEWDASMTCPRAVTQLAAYPAGRDQPLVGFPRKHGSHTVAPLASMRQDEPVHAGGPCSVRALATSMPSSSPYSYGQPPPPPLPSTMATRRTRPASAPAARAHASTGGGEKEQWGSSKEKDPTRREPLTVVTRHGGHARPKSARENSWGAPKESSTAAATAGGAATGRGPATGGVATRGGVAPLVLPTTFRVAGPPAAAAPRRVAAPPPVVAAPRSVQATA